MLISFIGMARNATIQYSVEGFGMTTSDELGIADSKLSELSSGIMM